MATAFSNVAADNLLDGALELGMRAVRIGRPATVRPDLWHATLDALVENHPEVVGERAGSPGREGCAWESVGSDQPMC